MQFIVPDVLLSCFDHAVMERLSRESTGFAIDPTNADYGRAFCRYMLFNNWPEMVQELQLSESDLYYNRYYWARTFASAFQTVHGPDAGLEQQVFKIFESAPPDVDWNVIEAIENTVGN